MKTSLAFAIVLVVQALSCSASEVSQMGVALQRQDGKCFATLRATNPPPDPYPADTCASAPSVNSVIAGADVLRLVVDFGVDFDEKKPAHPTTSLHMLVDGIEVPVTATEQQVGTDTERSVAFSFVLPAVHAGSQLRFFVTTTEGYSARLDPQVEVLAPILAPPVATCELPPCTYFAGAGTAAFKVSVPGARERSVSLLSRLEGVEQPVLATRTTSKFSATGTAVEADFTDIRVPSARPGTRWEVYARVDGADSRAAEFVLKGPGVSAPQALCGAAPCDFFSGVGSAAFDVSVDGAAPRGVALVSKIDGVEQLTTSPRTTDYVVDGRAHATLAIRVPLATPGSSWEVTALVDGIRSAPTVFTLGKPNVVAAFQSCGTPCILKSETTAVLRVSGPLDLQVKESTVTASLNGTAFISGAALTLDAVDRTSGRVFRDFLIPVPKTTSDANLQIDAFVGGFKTSTEIARVTP